jgi:hypothetical protein
VAALVGVICFEINEDSVAKETEEFNKVKKVKKINFLIFFP